MLVPAWLPPLYVCFCEAMNLVFLLCFLASIVGVFGAEKVFYKIVSWFLA